MHSIVTTKNVRQHMANFATPGIFPLCRFFSKVDTVIYV